MITIFNKVEAKETIEVIGKGEVKVLMQKALQYTVAIALTPLNSPIIRISKRGPEYPNGKI